MATATETYTYKPGDKPIDGFTIKRPIGMGGFGEVYLATTDAGKEVALKLVLRRLDIEERGVRHCMNQKHENLLEIYDLKTGRSGDRWIVMEYARGGSLADVIQQCADGMTPEQVLSWLRPICRAVDFLHERGITHRDLKPANIFLHSGVVKLGDYGLAKCMSPSKRSGHSQLVGTYLYMAPEIAQGRTYGREVDVYSVGVLLYEMFTGRPPFEGEEAVVMMKHLTEKPHLSDSRIPPKYQNMIARACAKDPAQRWNSLAEMLQATERRLPESLTRSTYRAITGALPAPRTLTRETALGMALGLFAGAGFGLVYSIVVLLVGAALGPFGIAVAFTLFGMLCGKILSDCIWDKREAPWSQAGVVGGCALISFLVSGFCLRFIPVYALGPGLFAESAIIWMLASGLIGIFLGGLVAATDAVGGDSTSRRGG
jgi:hypothetical protein